MTAPFRLDEQVTIEQRTAQRDPDFGTVLVGADGWEVLADHIWANVQDILPSRGGEANASGLVTTAARSRLRIKTDSRVETGMRVTLHGRGDRIMVIIAGPAQLDDRRHDEFMLDSFSTQV
jgi:head-tail adaptor